MFDEAKFQKEAAENAKKRASGDHVYHAQQGVIPIREARDLIRSGQATAGDFKGHPETGRIDWTKAGGIAN